MSYKYLKGVLLLVGLGLGSEAYADACELTDNFYSQNVEMDLGAVVITPDSNIKDVLLKKEFYIAGIDKAIRCKAYPWQSDSMDAVLLSPSAQLTQVDNTYTTNIPGIGIKLYREITGSGSGVKAHHYPKIPVRNIDAWVRLYDLAEGYFVVEIIKTADNTGTGKLTQGKYSSYHMRSRPDRPILTSEVLARSITITTSSCKLFGDSEKVVDLRPVGSRSFRGVGSTQEAKPFDISVKCVGGKNLQQPEKISLSFDYEAANGTNNVLKNLAADNVKAKGVGIQLVANNNPIAKKETVQIGNLNSEEETVFTLELEARYYQTEATVTAGEVQSTATVTIEYD